MKILLVRPPVPSRTIGLKHIMRCEPLELEYVAAGLKGHEVMIFDGIMEKGLEKRLRSFRPAVVGTGSYINGVDEVKRICRSVKAWNTACTTLVGGVHASRCPGDFSDPSIDCVVMCDGTSVAGEFVRALEAGRPLDTVAGLALPDGRSGMRLTAPREYMPHPDTLPLPRRDLVAHLRNRYYYVFHRPLAIIKTAWGCPYECGFCFNRTVTGGKVYLRSPESIVDELAQIEAPDVYIVDDLFLFDRKRLERIADLIDRRSIRKNYLVFGRADFIAENEDIVRRWAGIGLTAVLVGLEASTDNELTALEKRSTVDQNRQAIAVLQRCRVDTYASFITQPDYTPADWDRLRKFIDDNGLYFLNISPFTPLPGTSEWKKYGAQAEVHRRNHAVWDLSHVLLPTRMPLKKYYRALLWTYAKAILDLPRAQRIIHRRAPPVWSPSYLRIWAGAWRIFFQMLAAHHHHGLISAAKAPDMRVEK
ncbi:MAG: hypothetical protein A2024_04295 [Candidatus Edwardsbacteria bacterium GWF2_54_11]|uniref:Uncharacterized protein n=1 Tax=Candidatus Edwardsbacteria bacterium GWF2_54_11 TaxID=1817851 RepID=A0A1F5RDS5_9BACT|nr:MAG: hypothetical protein A2024_04295 [Candidatus Edwardsbacteria bacterium GWF2_54_11]